jgi:hypothetical protein
MVKSKEIISGKYIKLKEILIRNKLEIIGITVAFLFIWAGFAFFGYLSFIPDEKYKVQRFYTFDKQFIPCGCQSFLLEDLYYCRPYTIDSLEYPLYLSIIFESKGAFVPNEKIKVKVNVEFYRKNSSTLKEIKKMIIFFPGSISQVPATNKLSFDNTGSIILDIPTEDNVEEGIDIKGRSEISYGLAGDYQPFYIILQGENNSTYLIDSDEKLIDCPLLKIEPHSVARQIEYNNRIFALTLIIIGLAILTWSLSEIKKRDDE